MVGVEKYSASSRSYSRRSATNFSSYYRDFYRSVILQNRVIEKERGGPHRGGQTPPPTRGASQPYRKPQSPRRIFTALRWTKDKQSATNLRDSGNTAGQISKEGHGGCSFDESDGRVGSEFGGGVDSSIHCTT